MDDRGQGWDGPERRQDPARRGSVPAPHANPAGAPPTEPEFEHWEETEPDGRPLSRQRRRARLRRWLKGTAITFGAAAALAIGAVVVVTNTEWGRERVRRIAVEQIGKKAHGIVRIGRVRGNLLKGVTLENLSITDSAGNPFLAIEQVRARYALGAILMGKRLHFSDVTIVRPVLVLDRPPEGQWNWKRIFPKDTTPDTGPDTPGYGDWLRLENVRLVDGRAILRTPWRPDDTLSAAARDAEVREALGGGKRFRIVRHPQGFQKVSDFRRLTGRFPLLRIEEPGTPVRRIEVAQLSGILAPFLPPEGEIRDLAGAFEIAGDSLWFNGVRADFPGSRVVGDGLWNFDTDELKLDLRGERASFADFRWAYPRLPSKGGGTLGFAMHWTEEPVESQRYQISNADVAVGASRLWGNVGFTLTDTVEFHDTRMRVRDFDTRLMEQLIEDFEMPRNGFATGRIALGGGLLDLHLDADVAFRDPLSGTSNVVAKGVIGFGDDGLERAKDFRLRFYPAQVALARAVLPDFPLEGTLAGVMTLDGTRSRWMASAADLVHVDEGQRSHIVGRATLGFGPRPEEAFNYTDVKIDVAPLALATTIGEYLPELGLRGAVTGPITLSGPFERLRVAANLGLPAGGRLRADGMVGIGSVPSYDMRVAMSVLDASRLSTKAPATSLSLAGAARGRGTDPATLTTDAAFAVQASRYGELALDSARVALHARGGLLTLDTLIVGGPGVRATAGGQFGLAANRRGTVSYSVLVDSLGTFRRWLPQDTGVVAPRPAVVARVLERAREDSLRIAKATEVERAATGAPAPRLVVDTPQVIRRDSLAGRLYVAGVASGTLKDFTMRGRGGAEGLVYGGNAVREARAEYAWRRTPRPADQSIVAAADLDGVRAAGFALERAEARIAHRPGAQGGTAQVLLRQEQGREYAAHAAYRFHRDHREAHLDDLRLRFDTTTWKSAGPSEIRWGATGFFVESLDLRSGETGRVYVDGFIPKDPGTPANLRAIVTDFEVGDVISLAQSDIRATGRFSFGASFAGTLRDPRISGAAGVVNPTYGGTAVPDIRTRFSYANARLTASAEGLQKGLAVVAAEGNLPINLAMGATGPRVDRNAPLRLDLRADSLPLEVLPQLTDVVSNVRGRAVGRVAITGSIEAPRVNGALALDLGSFRVVPTGMNVRDLVGTMQLAGDTLVIDSLVGQARGPIRLEGGIGFAELTRPSFDLRMEATNAEVLRNDRGTARADAQIAMYGPFESVYVTGQARIREGVIYLPEDSRGDVISANDPTLFAVADTASATERELLPSESPLLAGLRMNLALAVNRDTWVRSREANVEVYSDGWLRIFADQRARSLAVEGVMNSDRGEYTFLSKRFNIKRGSATFIGTPDLNPTVQATAEYEVRVPAREAMYIRLAIGGTVRNLRLSLESDAQPPVSQSDLLSYLAFGRSSSSLLQLGGSSAGSGTNLAGTTAAIARNQIAAVALGVAVGEVEGRAARSLGLDVFNITPADVQTELWNGDVGGFASATEIEAGRYWSPRWFTGLQARPVPLLFGGATDAPPGAVVQYRTPGGFRVEASTQPRYLLQTPTLQQQNAAVTSVLGLFLIREWRF